MGKCMSKTQKEQDNINNQKQTTYNAMSTTNYNTNYNTSKKHYNPNMRRQNPEEARNNAAIAAANRMNAQTKLPDSNANATKVTKQKKKMINALADIEKREKELEQIKANRIKKGQTVD